MTSLDVKLSRPLVGSSRNRTRGEVIRAMPMLVRLAWPPLIPLSSELPILTCLQVGHTGKTRAQVSSRGRFNALDAYGVLVIPCMLCICMTACLRLSGKEPVPALSVKTSQNAQDACWIVVC